MLKKNLAMIAAGAGLMAMMAMPAFAADTAVSGTMKADASVRSQASIACVGTAVGVREQAIDAAMTAHTASVNAAYSARATALASAYSLTTTASVRAAVKTAWSDFRTSMKSAKTAWQSARTSAWATFRTSAKACKAPASVSDAGNASSEASGQ